MSSVIKEKASLNSTLLYVLLAVLIVVSVGLGIFSYTQYTNIESLETTQKNLETEREDLIAALDSASSTVETLKTRLEILGEELEDLADDYEDERDKNEEFEDRISDLGKTVGVLDKLARTDEELLRKYSKVSFLNENYIPETLREIDDQWKYDESRSFELHGAVMPYFDDMLEDALDDGIKIYVVSAYRSFDYQADLKQKYLVTYGTGANAFSADQGFSEHQLGTTVDFTTTGIGGGLEGFGNTAAYEWLRDNAHRYGFVLSYPPDNQYYVYEPWHWRFVGEELADDLKDDNAYFYDWDQRRINEYLVNIFD